MTNPVCFPSSMLRIAADRAASLPSQIAVAFIGLCLAAFAPPARGAMLLVPICGGLGATITVALANGATMLSAGPVPDTVVVAGERDAIVPAMLRQGTLVIAATPLICGDIPQTIEGDA